MASEIIDLQKECLFDLPKIEDSRGNLSFVEEGTQIPFEVARVYWIYDVPGGQKRGSHAFKSQQEIIIALSGSFDVVLNDGVNETKYQMNRAYRALYIPAKMWRSLENFATNSVCLVISSSSYDESDYIRNFRHFKQYLKLGRDLQVEDKDKKISSVEYDSHRIISRSSVLDCTVVDLPVIRHRAGNLTPIHSLKEIPFQIKRLFFVYDIPYGKTRGRHAHRNCQQFLLSASGSFDIELHDGSRKRKLSLNRPMQGIYVPSGIWTRETNYSSGAVCLVLASDIYQEDDYIRKFSDFKDIYGNSN